MVSAHRALRQRLEAAGCPDADFDARELYRFVTGRDPRLDAGPTPAEAARLDAMADRRAAREPLQYLLGEWEFMGVPLKVGPGVLCPRPDTEVVCEAAVELLRAAARPAPAAADLCAGTGCLGLGLRRFVPNAAVTCVEKSEAAFAYLKQNTAGTGVAAVLDDAARWCAACPAGSLDLIVSNPPYLTAAEMRDLMPETAAEPAMALDGGPDGLDFYRLLTRCCLAPLRPGGWLVLEIGWQQKDAVLALAAAAGWTNAQCRPDYAARDRAVLLQKP